MGERTENTQRPRPLRMRFLALGIDHLRRVPEQQKLSADEPKPLRRLRGDERHRLIAPVRRYLTGRQSAPLGAFRKLGCILTLVLRRAAPIPERLVGAVGVRVVADVEIRTELGRGDEESPRARVPDVRVTERDGP